MKRRGFLASVLAALGVGSVVGAVPVPLVDDAPTPAPPLCQACPGDLMEDSPCPTCPHGMSLYQRLSYMIARDRALGLEVNYFHTNGATMEELRADVGFAKRGPLPELAQLTFEGVRWCRVDTMADGEIEISDMTPYWHYTSQARLNLNPSSTYGRSMLADLDDIQIEYDRRIVAQWSE